MATRTTHATTMEPSSSIRGWTRPNFRTARCLPSPSSCATPRRNRSATALRNRSRPERCECSGLHSRVAHVQARLPGKAELARLFPLGRTDWDAVNKPDPACTTVTWIGHASFLVSVGGATFLTDPVFSSRASPLPFVGPWRYAPLPFGVAELPPIDFVLISHSHYDHLDLGSVLQLGNGPVWYVGLGLGSWFKAQGITNVVELDWWHSVEHRVGGSSVKVTATPSQHWSARTPFDRMTTLWCSWHVQGAHSSFFFAGDTALCPAFRQIRQRLGPPTVAALPIGAYLPRQFMRHHHASPQDAVEIHEDLGAQWSVGCHWGTLRQKALEHVAQPPRDLAAELARKGLPHSVFEVCV